MTCESCQFWNDWDTIKDGWTECMATGANPEVPRALMRSGDDATDFVQTHYTFGCSLYRALSARRR